MRYLPTAFANLSFAWKLYNYGLDGRIDLEALDVPLRFQEEGMMFVLPDRIFESRDDLIVALENNLGIAFGAAAITLYIAHVRSMVIAGLLKFTRSRTSALR